jgi:MFS family permease
MIWPFLLIFTSEKLSLPLSKVATLITINAVMGLFSSFLAGAVSDKVGRKLVMVLSLAINGFGYLLMNLAHTYLGFAFLMALMGASNPLYQVGSDAMLADMIETKKRTQAYAIIRMINNAGIAIGPAIGGFIATRSYTYSFLGAASGMIIYSLLFVFKAKETLDTTYITKKDTWTESLGGYKKVFNDHSYIFFALLVGIGLIAPSMLWTLLSVYTKQNFGLSEGLFGWLPTTNALLCVFVQFPVTLFTRRFRPSSVISFGMLLYALGVGSVTLMHNFFGFWISMVLMTFGELTLIPTVSKHIADQAPADMRGRYMSFYWFSWGIARGAGPLIGGFLNDIISPHSIWVGGLIIGLASTLGLLLFASRERKSQQV